MSETVRILYVEDNTADARLLKEYLAESRGEYRLHTVTSLGETLDYLANNHVDLILCDLSLPDSQGYDTFKKIHAHSQRVPILVLSGLADEETALRVVHEGAQDYLVKGRFNPDALSRAIRYSLERDRAAKKLLESEKRYRSVGELIPFGTWTASTDGSVTYLSDIFLEMAGMSMDECRGYGWTAAVHPDDVHEMVSAWKKCIHEETPWERQFRIRDRFGNYRTVLSRGTPVLSYRGEVISWSGINLDISERAGYIDALSETNRQLDTVVNTTHILLAFMDPEFNFVWVNRAYAEADGKDPSYFRGKNHFDLFPYGENREIFTEVVRTGKPYYAYARPFEYAEHPERGVSYWDWTLVPTKDGDGNVTGLLFSLADVTDRIQMEQSLRVSEEKHRLLVESANSVITVTQDGVIKFINERVTDFLGYSADELIGRETSVILDDDTAVAVFEQPAERAAEKVSLPSTHRIRHKNGGILHVEVTGTLMMWEGRPAFLNFVTDVTERKRAEEALQASEIRYRRLFEAAKDGILILNADTGNITDVNPYLLSMLGYSADELLGKKLWEIGLFKDIAANKEGFRQLQDKGYIRYEDLPLQTKDGHSISVEFVSNVYFADHTKVIQCNIRNITERKRAEEQLKEAHLNLQLALKAGSAGTWDWNIETDTFTWSEEFFEVFGMDPETTPGFDAWTSAVFPDDREIAAKRIRDAIDLGKDLSSDYRIVIPGGETRWIRSIGRTFYRGPAPVRMIGLCIDITQQKQADEMIAQSLAEKEALLREIHHRVKNNLQTVSSLLAMAGMSARNREATDLLRDAESRVHAMALIHSQLYGSRRLDRIDVKGNIKELTERLSSIYSTSSRRIIHSVEGDGVSLTIHQAIPCALAVNEIVTNSFKYAFEGKQEGTITIRVKRTGSILSITIADNGVGLPDGFDVDSAETLGVRLVKNLIEGQLSGQVDFSSPAGTKVTIGFGIEEETVA